MIGSSKPQRPELTEQQASELVARALEAAQGNAPPERISEIREELEVGIESCNRWVARLATWARRGLLVEAASVNESYPELCRVAHVLAMVEARLAWDQACNRSGVPLNSRIEERAYLELSDAVGDASSLDELVQRFQVAVLGRKSLTKRMKALLALRAAAPRNEALVRLVKKYEGEALATIEAGCREAAEAGRAEELDDAIEAIEGFQWQSHFSSEFMSWIKDGSKRRNREAAEAKFEEIAKRVEAAFPARDLMLLGTLQEETDEVQRLHRVEPGDRFRNRTREALAWAEAERERLRVEADHQEDCEIMRRAIDQGCGYPELEPLHGRVLRHGLGVPTDVAARFGTAEAEWRGARRRRASVVVAATALAVIGILASVLALSYQRSERARAEGVGVRIRALASEGDFDGAQKLLDAVLAEDPWMAEVAELQSAGEQLREGAPRHRQRREEVRRMLAAVPPGETKDEARIAAMIGELQAALAKTDTFAKLTPDEADSAKRRVADLSRTLSMMKAERIRELSEEFLQLRRDGQSLPRESDRTSSERGSVELTSQYLGRVRVLDQRIQAFISRAPADLPERAEAQALRDRLAIDISAAEQRMPGLKQASSLVARLATRPNSESEYAEVVRSIATDHAADAVNLEPILKDGLGPIQRSMEAAKAIENWRSSVLPSLLSQNQVGIASIPSARDDAVRLLPILEAHLQNFPESPYTTVAGNLKSLCGIAARSQEGTAASAALEAVAALGLRDVWRVPLIGHRFAFTRNDVPGEAALRGLVQQAGDLTVPPGQLGTSIPANQDRIGGREPSTWRSLLDKFQKDHLQGSIIDVQAAWLRMLDDLRSQSPVDEHIATGPVLLELMNVFSEHLADGEGIDKQLCSEIRRIRENFASMRSGNWPGLAIAPPRDTKRQLQLDDFRNRLNPALPRFSDIAARRQDDWRAWSTQVASLGIAGVLLPAKPEEGVRRATPAQLTGPYFLLCFDAKSRRWVLRECVFSDGKLQAGPDGVPPYALIYTRIGK